MITLDINFFFLRTLGSKTNGFRFRSFVWDPSSKTMSLLRIFLETDRPGVRWVRRPVLLEDTRPPSLCQPLFHPHKPRPRPGPWTGDRSSPIFTLPLLFRFFSSCYPVLDLRTVETHFSPPFTQNPPWNRFPGLRLSPQRWVDSRPPVGSRGPVWAQ